MNRQTDYFRLKYNIGQTIYPEKHADTGIGLTSDDLYASDLDDADADFVKDTFGLNEASSDGVLCCPGCFTPICYKSRINVHGQFQSDEAVNISVVPASVESAGSRVDLALDSRLSVKRPVSSEASPEQRLVARCDECQNVVASLDESGIYHFIRVIASAP